MVAANASAAKSLSSFVIDASPGAVEPLVRVKHIGAQFNSTYLKGLGAAIQRVFSALHALTAAVTVRA